MAGTVRLALVCRASTSHLYQVPVLRKCSTKWHTTLVFLLYNFNDDLLHNSKQPDFITFSCSLKKPGKKLMDLCECAQLIFNCAVEKVVETGR